MKIRIATQILAPLDTVWNAWVTPSDISEWNFASDDWCCPSAELDPKSGGQFSYRMEARDGSVGFDFEGTFNKVVPKELIQFEIGDGRQVLVEFLEMGNGVKVVETFEAEDSHLADQQKQGWQSILDNFKRHVESKSN